MLFDSSLRKDLSRSFGGTLVVVLTIVLTVMLIRMLGLAARGSASPEDVALLLGYATLGQLPILLCLSVFVAVVSTLTRMYRDSEMAVWLASGVSLTRFVRPVARFVTPVLLAVAGLTLVVWPWTNRNISELRDRYEKRSDLSRVEAGQFQTSADGRRVFFIDKDAPSDGTGRNVFILEQREDRESVTTAQSGRVEYTPQGQRLLSLANGARTDLDTRGGTRTISRFDHYQIRIGEAVVSELEALPPKARHSLDLLRDGGQRARGELVWRLGMIVVPLNLMLLGLGLAAGSHRRAGGVTLLVALLAFVVYLNLVNLSQAWVGSGKAAMLPALLGVHLSMFLIAVSLLWWRNGGANRCLVRRSPASA
ncbi:lipopolysaccharide export system permease protein [Sphaerotilus hippei]|uniref:Lipopolysaccharide export system permease protein LptF n=1 Tax=Sphaerotilus hippei TaxID=744406 RepID=A0A318H272_9BURK|nr:LPS export ABC transporter permease LptF [Sphaerotilus hippei]PXW94746.1 lipopolysaccharide export system permease protein [Sphaerotilus hippei]